MDKNTKEILTWSLKLNDEPSNLKTVLGRAQVDRKMKRKLFSKWNIHLSYGLVQSFNIQRLLKPFENLKIKWNC